MKILVSGSMAYDRIMDFPGKFEDHILPDKIHVLNVSFEVNGLKENFGGTAGNIAYSLSLLKEKPIPLAAVGVDFDRYRRWLKENNIDLSGIRSIPDVFTAGAYITTDLSDNQITGFNPGAMKYTSDYSFSNVDPLDCLAIISPGNTDDMIHYCRKYKALGIPYIMDPGQQIPVLTGKRLNEMISGAYLLVSNDYELDMIKKAVGADTNDLLKLTPTLITTLGENGSVIVSVDGEKKIPAIKVKQVVDPTGAGDAYRAGLIKGLVMGGPIAEAARMGATCAAYAVECYGTQAHRFTLDEFRKRYAGSFNA
jgi:adenosine kinase